MMRKPGLGGGSPVFVLPIHQHSHSPYTDFHALYTMLELAESLVSLIETQQGSFGVGITHTEGCDKALVLDDLGLRSG